MWIGLSAAGIEPATSSAFFDDWSHSLLSTVVLALLFALCFWHRGTRVCVPVGAAVFSHFALDAIIHPKPLALFPLSKQHLPWNLWQWGALQTPFGFSHYWWVQFAIVIPLLSIYVIGAQRNRFPRNLMTATALLVIGLQLLV